MHLQRYLVWTRPCSNLLPRTQIQHYKILYFKYSFECYCILPHNLKAKGTSLSLFLHEVFVKAEDDGDRQKDTCTTSDGTHEIGNDGQGTNAHTSKGSGSRDVSVQDMDQGGITVSLHDHLVVTELLGNITSRRSRNLNPGLTEKSTGSQDEGQVEDGVERIVDDFRKGSRRGNVVSNSSDRDLLSHGSLDILPLSEKTNQDIGRGTVVQKLGDKVQVGNKGGLKDDRHVRGVEKLDRVVSLLSTVLLVLDRKIDTPSLEVNDNDEDQNGSQKVGQVRKILTVESLFKGLDLVGTSDEKVEEGNDGSFEFGTTSSVDGGGTESLPDDSFTNVGGDENGDTRSKTVSLLQELVESKNNQSRAEELEDDQNGITGTDGAKISVHSTGNISDSFTKSDKKTEKFLGTREQGTIFLDVVVDLDDSGTGQKLHNQTRSDNGTNTKFHKGTTVGSHDDTHPVERITGLGRLDTIERDLAANQENEKDNGSPKKLLAEGNLSVRGLNLREDRHDGADQMQKSHGERVSSFSSSTHKE